MDDLFLTKPLAKLVLVDRNQYRSHEIIPDTNQFLVKLVLAITSTENNNNILLGYAFIHSENYQTEILIKLKLRSTVFISNLLPDSSLTDFSFNTDTVWNSGFAG